MARTSFQRLIAVLCLVAIGLGQAVFGSFSVRCEDLSGQSHLELVCAKTDDGFCAKICDAPEDEAGLAADSTQSAQSADDEQTRMPLPCKDRPIREPAGLAKLLPRSSTHDVAPVIVVPAVVEQVLLIDVPGVRPVMPTRAIAGPPDTVARLRSVILTV